MPGAFYRQKQQKRNGGDRKQAVPGDLREKSHLLLPRAVPRRLGPSDRRPRSECRRTATFALPRSVWKPVRGTPEAPVKSTSTVGRPPSYDLTGLLGPARYRRSGDELVGRGLYFDPPPWGFHLFRIQAIG